MSRSEKLKQIVEAALLAAGRPLTLESIQELFLEEERPDKKSLREVLKELQGDYQGRGIEVAEVGGGFRINVRAEFAPWISRLWEERPPRYSRALMETLALIAYRQPITRGEIEEIRGVSVSSNIMKSLLEREWVRVVGQRDVPGRPSLYATTREFLNYFGLKSLDDLPSLQEIRDLDSINRELALGDPDAEPVPAEVFAQAVAEAVEGESEMEILPEQVASPEEPDDPGASDPVTEEGEGAYATEPGQDEEAPFSLPSTERLNDD